MKSHNTETLYKFGLWSIHEDKYVLINTRDNNISSPTLKMIYKFDNHLIAAFVFKKSFSDNKYWIDNYGFNARFSDDYIQSITFIDANACYASLINYYLTCLKMNTYDKNIFRKHVLNYLEGPLTDSLDYELNHGLIISDIRKDDIKLASRILSEEVFPILTHEGIHCSYLSDMIVWLRDYVLPMGNGKQYLMEDMLLNEDDVKTVYRLAESNRKHVYSRNWPHGYAVDLGGACLDNARENTINRRRLHTLCQNNDVTHDISDVILEGGNIITLTRNDKTYVIVGKNLQYANAVYLYGKPAKCEYQLNKNLFKQAKLAIENRLNLPKNRITWLDNYDYHLDIYLALGPPNVIFIHSNILTMEYAQDDYYITGSSTSFNVSLAAHDQEKIAGDVLRKNTRKLTAHGYKVVEVPGVGYDLSNADDDNSYPMVFNLMNGYSGKGKNGFFYITLTACVDEIQKVFANILHRHGVDNVYFVGTPEEAINILNLEGSLRCASISASTVFGHLGSLFGSNKMNTNIADVDNEEDNSFCNDKFTMEGKANLNTLFFNASNDEEYKNNDLSTRFQFS